MCSTFFKATIDLLWSLVGTAVTIVASLLAQPSGHADGTAVFPVVLLASYSSAADVNDLTAALRDADPSRRVIAACELERLGSAARAAIPALIERLSDNSPVEPNVCGKDRHFWSKDITQSTSPGEEAAAALVAIGSDALSPLIAASRAPQWVARRNAVWAIGSLDDGRGIAAATSALTDREPPVRRVAAWALGALDANDALPALISALTDQDGEVRAQVVWALGAIGDARAVDGLIGALKDTVERVRAQAAWALGSIGDHRAIPALSATLKDSAPMVRKQAAWALGSIGR
jgi:HEAT repeat protein